MKRYQKRIQVLLPLPVKSAPHPWDPLQDYHLFTALRISKSTNTPVTNLRSITSGERGRGKKKKTQTRHNPLPRQTKYKGGKSTRSQKSQEHETINYASF
jgi:hypothetical protein